MYTELTSEQFIERCKAGLQKGRKEYPIGDNTWAVLNDILNKDKFQCAYDMYLYCLDVYNKVRVGEEAKVTVDIDNNRGKKYVITGLENCIKLKKKYKTYENLLIKFSEDLNLFGNWCKHIPKYKVSVTMSLDKIANNPQKALRKQMAPYIKVFSLFFGAVIYLEDIWDYIPVE